MILKKQNNLTAVGLSIVVHAALGTLLVLGLSNDLHLSPSFHTSNTVWISLESGNGNATTSPVAKSADKKQSNDVAVQKNPTISAAKIIPVQNNTVKEEKAGQLIAAVSSISLSDATNLSEAGQSSGFVSANPLYRENTPPVYPAIAKLHGYEGIVLVNAEILPNGRVGSTEVSKSSGYTILDQSAIEAVKHWKFEPAKKAGKPFAVRVKLPIKFILHDESSQS
jgi:periplasmic protein TonB